MNRHRETTVNSKTTPIGYGPTVGDMRMSRLSHPRATLVAMILLAAVFLLFGMFASAVEPACVPAPTGMSSPASIDGSLSLIGHWVVNATHGAS